ncbi:exo 1,3/1,4-beta-D-glucan glucohydrolase [Steroidobacter sp. S1-65]|uniref:Exo 1,3/1,4-beta-D-glucan glucohydrolase n=1 Tax=Steroidobacter gossypii TaxID=2805490 RepID=A0ABS1WS89_9GAMM|nr:exo 1,3/1,4-beta-D-glucan glucohydrolase [Steroidobacter gossypii]MBM0103820.1 exo 1,3/1,4-beta-D-glucan glucohydrolase [Steroidobacter gossypii]
MIDARARAELRGAIVTTLLTVALTGCSKKEETTGETQPSRITTASNVHPEIWPQVSLPALDDTAIEPRLNELLSSLSVEEKVGQIIQADVGSVTAEDVRRYRLGSVLNGGNSAPGGDDLAPARVWLAAADAFYEASMDTSDGKHAIPIMWGVDAVHGHNNIIGATLFPHNVGLGATRNAELMRRIGAITATELRVTGQEWTFAPTIAVAQDVRWGRAYESYSENPTLVREYAHSIVLGLQGDPGKPDFLRGNHVIATAKHFLADGGTFEGRDQGDARITEEQLRDLHAPGYVAAISAGVQVVMASFSSWQGKKITGHHGLLTDVLKNRMGFDGFVVGDWNAHGQVEGCSNVSCPAAINAGLDMFMAPDSWKELYDNTLAQVKSGEIPMARLDDAVRRILRVKLRAGLFEAGKPSSRAPGGKFDLLGSAEHRAVARQAVRESLVLLKNDNKVLPLKPSMKVLVAGDGADNLPKQNGGWTLTWQGTGIENKHFPKAESIFAGIRSAVKAGGGTATLSVDGKYTRKPDVAIVVFGEDPYAEFQGDIATLEYKPGNESDLELLKKFRADQIPVVAVFLSGRPLWVNPELNAADAFVAAWLPGSEGGGIADVLFTKRDGSVNHDFKGKLPFAWPRTPLMFNSEGAPETPLFDNGFGLTYQDTVDLPVLSEEVPAAPGQASTHHYFAAGRPSNGWQLAVGAGDAARTALPGAVGSAQGDVLQISAIDRAAQEDARLAKWSGAGPATLALQGEAPIDLQREANGQLSVTFEYRIDAPPSAKVMLGIECGPGCRGDLPIEAQLKQAPAGEWRQFKMPLHCFQNKGADLRNVTAPFLLSTAGKLELGIANVRLESGLNDAPRCE